jgi:UDP-glucose 4-epimerase
MPSGEHSQVNVTILPQTISIRRHLLTEIGEAGRVASAQLLRWTPEKSDLRTIVLTAWEWHRRKNFTNSRRR